MHTLVELWAWGRSHEELCDRSNSPWDDVGRRPSQANRRKSLRRLILRTKLSTLTDRGPIPEKFIQQAKHMIALAA